MRDREIIKACVNSSSSSFFIVKVQMVKFAIFNLWYNIATMKNNITQMLYFTLAYDWFLFGHNLKNRVEKGELIMVFCFSFLKYIKGNNFSVVHDEYVNQKLYSNFNE